MADVAAGGVPATVSGMVRGVSLVTLAVAVVLVAGCGQKSKGEVQGGPSPSPSATPSSTPSGSPTPAGTAAPLPETCVDVLTLDEMDNAVGHALPGQTVYIKGQAEPKIHRIGRVTCRYGVHKAANHTVVPLEVGVSGYADADSAASRIRFTVNQQRNNGATPTDVSLGDAQGTALVAGDSALLIFAKGTTTAAISVTKDVATGDQAKDVLTKLGTAVAAHLP
jgi:hypothetical protein